MEPGKFHPTRPVAAVAFAILSMAAPVLADPLACQTCCSSRSTTSTTGTGIMGGHPQASTPNVGRLLGALESSPHKENTIVVLWGDHGWHLGEKRHWRKLTLWERGTRTPFILAAPEVGARRVEALRKHLPTTWRYLMGKRFQLFPDSFAKNPSPSIKNAKSSPEEK